MSDEMGLAIRQLIEERGISQDLVIRTIEETLLAAYRRKFGTEENAVVRVNEEGSEIAIFAQKRIVETVDDSVFEISLDDAVAYNEDAEVGDELLIEINPREFDRVAIQSAKQRARQTLRDIQKDTLYSEFEGRVGELVVGYHQRERNGTIFVDLGKTEGILPRKYQSPREQYRPNDRVRAMIFEVEKAPLGLQIVLSRTHTEFVKKIFELEVPEIYDHTIEIHRMVREPGYRTKMSVYSTRDDVDPVGACVGMRGVRIQTVVRELEGEKIDVLRYDPDPRTFITEALKPAEIEQVIVLDDVKRQALAVVPESQFSLAIGKQGLNVRLANRLTDWNIDVRTRTQVNEMDIGADAKRAVSALFGDVSEEITQVAELPGIEPRVAAALKEADIELIEALVATEEAQLRAIEGLTDENVGALLKLIEENVEIVDEETVDPAADGTEMDAGYAGEGFGGNASGAAAGPGISDAEALFAPVDPDEPTAAFETDAAVQEEQEEEVDLEEGIIDAEDGGTVPASSLPGLPEEVGSALIAAGLDDVVALLSVGDAELAALPGMDSAAVATLRRVIDENVEVVDEEDE
jgi:N utilization substance protein A